MNILRNACTSLGVVLSAAFTLSPALVAQEEVSEPDSVAEPAPVAQPVGTMSDLMVQIIYPASDAIFYIATRTPTTTAAWSALEGQTLMLAESANLLMMPSRARDEDQWMRDAKLMLDAGEAAFFAAKDRDVEALIELNDQLYQSCVTCHRHYRPGYGRRRGSGRPLDAPPLDAPPLDAPPPDARSPDAAPGPTVAPRRVGR